MKCTSCSCRVTQSEADEAAHIVGTNSGHGTMCVSCAEHTACASATLDECDDTRRKLAAFPDMLEALRALHNELRRHIKMDVKKHYSLMLADAAAVKAIRKAVGDE